MGELDDLVRYSRQDIDMIRAMMDYMGKPMRQSDYALVPAPEPQTDDEAEAELMGEDGYIDAVGQEDQEA